MISDQSHISREGKKEKEKDYLKRVEKRWSVFWEVRNGQGKFENRLHLKGSGKQAEGGELFPERGGLHHERHLGRGVHAWGQGFGGGLAG